MVSDEERKAKNREWQRAYRERQGETRREYMRQWRTANRDRVRVAQKRWEDARTPEQKREAYEKQRDRAIPRAAEWNRANRERRAEITRKHSQQDHVKAKARLRNYKHEARDYAAILAGDPCCYCGESSQHIDHIEPLSCGGDG